MSDPFHNNVSVSPVHGSWEGERRTGGWLCACLPRREGGSAADRAWDGAGKRGAGERLPGAAWPDHCMMTTAAAATTMNSTGFLKRK